MTPGLLPNISWSICTEKSHSMLHLSFSITTSGLCSYHFSFTSIPYFLHVSQWIFVPNQSRCLLYSFWANLLLSLNTWFTLSSAFLRILHLLFSWVSSIFPVMLIVLIACSCAAIMKASFVLFKHPFLSHPHRSSLVILIICLMNCPCNCFCVHRVFHSFFFLFLYSFGVSQSSSSSIVRAAINNLCYFSRNLLTPRLLSPQYLGLQSILCRLRFLIDTVYFTFRVESIVHSWSLDHPRNAAEYLTTDTAQVLITLKTFPLFNFVSNTFLTLL